VGESPVLAGIAFTLTNMFGERKALTPSRKFHVEWANNRLGNFLA